MDDTYALTRTHPRIFSHICDIHFHVLYRVLSFIRPTSIADLLEPSFIAFLLLHLHFFTLHRTPPQKLLALFISSVYSHTFLWHCHASYIKQIANLLRDNRVLELNIRLPIRVRALKKVFGAQYGGVTLEPRVTISHSQHLTRRYISNSGCR